jgi:hypothetical protein
MQRRQVRCILRIKRWKRERRGSSSIRNREERAEMGGSSARMPIPVFKISMTASLALRMSGNRAVATVVGTTGARRMVTSVTMPRVPSAPMKSLVVSNPADDLRDRRLVFITSPEGRTTVCPGKTDQRTAPQKTSREEKKSMYADRIQEPFTLRCAVADCVGYWEQ